MKKYLPALVTGFSAGVLHVVPIAKSLTCCLIVPIAAFISITLAAKSENILGNFSIKRGAYLGFLTGIFAAFFGSFFDIFINEQNTIINSTEGETLKEDIITFSFEYYLNLVNHNLTKEKCKKNKTDLLE